MIKKIINTDLLQEIKSIKMRVNQIKVCFFFSSSNNLIRLALFVSSKKKSRICGWYNSDWYIKWNQ